MIRTPAFGPTLICGCTFRSMATAITCGRATLVFQQAPICDQSHPHRYGSDPVAGCPGYDICSRTFLIKLGVEENSVAGHAQA